MASPYTSVTIADYNANPPTDDGAATPANELNWSKHKEKLGDPIKTLSEAINTNLIAAFGDRLLNAEAQKTGIYTVLATDRGSLINCTANTFTVTLLAAATAGDGFEVIIYNSGSGVITVDGNASETVNGAATQTLQTGGWLMLRCDGSNWTGIGGNENSIGPGITSTTAEINELDASVAAVTDYASGVRTYFYDDVPDTTAFSFTTMTVSTWESVGPTSSGATNIWTALDDVPAGATGIILRVYNSIAGATNGDIYSAVLYARVTGSSGSTSTHTLISSSALTNRSGGTEQDRGVSEVIVPIDGNLRFDAHYTQSGTGPTITLSGTLVGFIA